MRTLIVVLTLANHQGARFAPGDMLVLPMCTGVTVSLHNETPRVSAGESPRFAATIRNTTGHAVRLLDVRDGKRTDLLVNYFELVATRDGKLVEMPIAISDPGPISDADFFELPAGREVRLAISEYSRELSSLPLGRYDVVLRFWREPTTTPAMRCRSSATQLIVQR